MDAEHNAAAWMRYLGHPRASVTAGGADGGVDVRAPGALAQVKMRVGRVSRPEVQRLVGAAGRNSGLALFFFSFGGYTADALAYARQSEIAAFTFMLDGDVTPVTPMAVKALKAAREQHAPKPKAASPAPGKHPRSMAGVDTRPSMQGRESPKQKLDRLEQEQADRRAAAAAKKEGRRSEKEARKLNRDTARKSRAERPAPPKPEELPVGFTAVLATVVLGLAGWLTYTTVNGMIFGEVSVLRVLGAIAGGLFLLLGCALVVMTVDARNAGRAARTAGKMPSPED